MESKEPYRLAGSRVIGCGSVLKLRLLTHLLQQGSKERVLGSSVVKPVFLPC